MGILLNLQEILNNDRFFAFVIGILYAAKESEHRSSPGRKFLLAS